MNSTEDSTLTRIRAAFTAAFDIDGQAVSAGTQPGDIPAWDSMGHVALVSALERTFGVNFDVDEVMEMENVEQIIRIVEAKGRSVTT